MTVLSHAGYQWLVPHPLHSLCWQFLLGIESHITDHNCDCFANKSLDVLVPPSTDRIAIYCNALQLRGYHRAHQIWVVFVHDIKPRLIFRDIPKNWEWQAWLEGCGAAHSFGLVLCKGSYAAYVRTILSITLSRNSVISVAPCRLLCRACSLTCCFTVFAPPTSPMFAQSVYTVCQSLPPEASIIVDPWMSLTARHQG